MILFKQARLADKKKRKGGYVTITVHAFSLTYRFVQRWEAETSGKQKRLRWARSLRNEAYGKFIAARESLRGLYDLIDLKKAELVEARDAFGVANSAVKERRSELRDACLKNDVPDDHAVYRDANSSDDNRDTDSVTDIETDEEDFASKALDDPRDEVRSTLFTPH